MPQPTAGPMPSHLQDNGAYAHALQLLKERAEAKARAAEKELGPSPSWAKSDQRFAAAKIDSHGADHRNSEDLVSTLLNLATESIPAYVEQSALMMIVVPVCRQ